MRPNVLAVCFLGASLASGLAACAESEKEPTYIVLSTDPTCGDGGARTGAGSGESTSTSSAVGAQCKAFLECCAELADAMPSMASSCASMEKQIEAAQEAGTSTASYESSCRSGLSAAKSAGYCE